MSKLANRSIDGKRRKRAKKLASLVEARARADRIDDTLAAVREAYPMSREQRATWLHTELETGRALLRLAADHVLLSDIAALTGIPAAECRRLMKAARVSDAPHLTDSARY